MFTGIIEAVGRIKNIEPVGGDIRLHVDVGSLDMEDVQLGDSIAVNGVCLTAIEFDDGHFVADVSNETITLTSLKSLAIGSEVNLEKALLPTTRLGGHLVSGHVDGLGEVMSIKEESRSIRLVIRAPGELKHYIAMKGSICIDGTSLTVNKISNADFEINIVPHTQQQTIIKNYKPGTRVNLEVDLIARYLERLLMKQDDNTGNGITLESLAKAGFVS
ncbi:MAG: riboflavin synthase [Gammaproteobacteria bacterium]|nr:riboflavin synthase [Gammaproteobacteria bacterium]MBT8135074.1 riboflavin synthase [Gammaproteobacteria bacterium]NNJ50245.1 riboflavin synthase [Gammaproteobacteria bacterium]